MLRGNGGEEMRKTAMMIVLVLVALLLVSCAKPETVIYKDTILTITRENTVLSVKDAVSGEEYIFRLHRVKRSDSTVKQAQTLLQTDAFTVRAAGRMLIVEEKGITVYIAR